MAPAPKKQNHTEPARTAQSARAKRPTVLVVDDEPSLLELVRDVVGNSNDCQVISAANLDEANRALACERIDLLLLDVNLPDGNGMTLLPALREKHPAAEAVVLTGYASLEGTITAMRAGVIDLLPKPFSADDLRDRVRKALERQSITSKQDKRLDRLRRAVRRLNLSRRMVSKKVDLLCNDLISAYGELSKQMDAVRTQEAFRKLLNEAGDLEQLLCHTMDWILRHAGYCNVAIWLASDAQNNELGAYMKYTIPGDKALTESMKQGLLPLTAQEGFLHLQPQELADFLTTEECRQLKDQTILAANCTYLGETLATMIAFRDGRSPFSEEDAAMMKTISPIFATILAATVRAGDEDELDEEEDDSTNEADRARGEDLLDNDSPFYDDTKSKDEDDAKSKKRRNKKREREERNSADWWKRGEPPPF
jgi:response regulator of citrate/malate metabolism